MARQRKLDETDRMIVEVIRAHQDANGCGPRYQDIAEVVDRSIPNIHYRVENKLVPAGLVRHNRYERGTLEVVIP